MRFTRFALVLLLPALLSAGDDHRLASPEVEIQRALTHLENIENLLEGSTKAINSQLIGAKQARAESAYEHALALFKQGHFMASSRQMSNFLNLVQSPDSKRYLHAQLTLARAYEQVGQPSRALRAYIRYIAAFSTSPEDQRNYEELTSVMHRTLPLSASDGEQMQTKLNQLFASVISMNMPKERKAEVYYYAASHSRDEKFANEWFERAAELSSDEAIDSRANYFRGVIALRNANTSLAENLFRRNLELSSKEAREYKDLSRLALARIALRQRNLDLALKHYLLIEDGSPSFKAALFESMYLHLDLGQSDQAQAKASALVAKFPESSEAFQAKSLLSYIELKAGNLENARQSITKVDDQLIELSQWLSKSFGKKDRVTHEDVNQIVENSHTHIRPSGIIQTGHTIFSKIADQRRRLADLRSDIRDLLYTLGRLNIKEFQPHWVRRADLLGKLSEKTLEVGHRLIASYAYLLRDQLSDTERHALAASQERRFRLLSHAAKLARNKSGWTTWASSVSLIHEASDKVEKVRDLKAELASSRYLNAKAETIPQSAKTDLALLQQKVLAMEESLDQTIEQIRKMQVLDLSSQGPYGASQTLHHQYANLLHEEAEIINQHLDRLQAPSWRFAARDAKQAWKRWEYVSKIVFESIVRLGSDISIDLKQLVTTLDKYIEDHDKLESKLTNIRQNLETILGDSLSASIAHYQSEIINRHAKNKKWKADMDWIEFEREQNEGESINRRLKLEEQILTDNLRDLRQGVFW